MTRICRIREQESVASLSTDGVPVITFKEEWIMRDNVNSWVGVQQARLNFAIETGIAPGQPYGDYIFATCRKVNSKRIRTKPPWQAWILQCEWSTESPKMDDANPANRRWIREVSDSDQQRFIIRDRFNNLIVDTAGTPIDGGAPVNVKLTTYNWEHNVDWSVYNLSTIKRLSGAINSDSFLGCDPYTLMMSYRAKENWEGTYHFATEYYTAIYDPLGWKPKLANAGLYQIQPATISSPRKRARIKIDGKDAIEPEPLDLSGAVIPYTSRPNACIFITVDYYNPIPFGSLGLPTN